MRIVRQDSNHDLAKSNKTGRAISKGEQSLKNFNEA